MKTCLNCGKLHNNNKFCSKSCSTSYNNKTTKKYTQPSKQKCIMCGNETTNPKFCCCSCSAKYNNSKKRPQKKYYCAKCNKLLGTGYLHGRSKLCKQCKKWDLNTQTIGELKNKHSTSNFHSTVRGHARRIFNKYGYTQCKKCGYNLHIEVCHIKPIESFDDNVLLSVVNSMSNLIGLCPNCHWEMDNGLLKI